MFILFTFDDGEIFPCRPAREGITRMRLSDTYKANGDQVTGFVFLSGDVDPGGERDMKP